MNRQPADYKSAALPIELRQQAILTPTRFSRLPESQLSLAVGAELRAEHINITIPSSESTGIAVFFWKKEERATELEPHLNRLNKGGSRTVQNQGLGDLLTSGIGPRHVRHEPG